MNESHADEVAISPEEFGLDPEEKEDLDNWFTYHPPSPAQIPVFEEIRDAGHAFAEKIMTLIPKSPDRDKAVGHVRAAVMNANSSLACYPEGNSVQ